MGGGIFFIDKLLTEFENYFKHKADRRISACKAQAKSIIARQLSLGKLTVAEIQNLAVKFVQIMYRRQDDNFLSFAQCVADNLFNEAQIPEASGIGDFWQLPVSYFKKWMNICEQNDLNFNESKVLLAWLWLHFNFERGPYFTRDDIVAITNLTRKTVTKYLEQLADKRLISQKQADDHYYQTDVTFQATPEVSINIDLDRSIVSDIDIEINLNQIENVQNVYLGDINQKNPFICIDKILSKNQAQKIKTFRDYITLLNKTNEVFMMRKQVLNVDYFLGAVLSETELRRFFTNIAGSNSNIKRKLDAFKIQIRRYHEYLNEKRSVPPELNSHYWQIYKVIPILHFIARREFMIDPIRGKELAALYSSRIKVLKDEIIKKYHSNKTGFIRDNHLDQQYLNYGKLTDIRIEESSKNRTVEFQFTAGQEKVTTGLITDTKVVEWCRYVQLYDDLKNVLDHTKQSLFASVMANFSVLDNLTHRIYFRGISTQNINKANRKVFYAGEGYQFLMIDISQMELQLLKLYLNYEFVPGEFDRMEFDWLAREMGVERSVAKITFYMWFYGAGKQRLLESPGMNNLRYKKFLDFIKQFNELRKFRGKLSSEARENHCTRKTPLGYKMPLEDRFYRASSCLIQATGAELFIKWLLLLHEKEKSQYIVNLIHDEIIFKIPVQFDIYDFAKHVKRCLDLATTSISRIIEHKLHFNTKQYVSKYWDKQSAAEIII